MSWPVELLQSVAWACGRQRQPDRAAFGVKVSEYNDDVMDGRSSWAPNQRVLEAARVQVQFMCWTEDGEDQPEFTLDIAADDGRGFTQLELFHRICDGIAARLEAEGCQLFDHRFFEGLALGGEGPFYNVRFGS